MRSVCTILFSLLMLNSAVAAKDHIQNKLDPYIQALEKGEDPQDFVLKILDKHDLLLFDDGLHTAVEPFEFYQKLARDTRFQEKVQFIFIEAISLNHQPLIDAYMTSDPEDISILYPAFQDDFSGFGWSFKTYFDFLKTLREVNLNLPTEKRFKVIGVSNPVYWSAMHCLEDVELFRKSLTSFDYTMYRIILSHMQDFKSNKKGIFLTNTRHAYKNIKNRENKLYWNCGTFFYQWHPQKTYSIRFNNVNLYFEKRINPDPDRPATTEGLENAVVRWVRMENGLWDSAFEASGQNPVALALQSTPFGKTNYIGNHMLNVAPGQTIYDAYDAIIFLGPLENSRQTALVDFLYTPKFKKELARRFRMLYTEKQLNKTLEESNSASLQEHIDKTFVSQPEKILPQTQSLGPVDAWKKIK